MNDHRFSYPVVVPLRGATISGHAVQPAPVQAVRLLQPPVRPAAANTLAGNPARVAA